MVEGTTTWRARRGASCLPALGRGRLVRSPAGLGTLAAPPAPTRPASARAILYVDGRGRPVADGHLRPEARFTPMPGPFRETTPAVPGIRAQVSTCPQTGQGDKAAGRLSARWQHQGGRPTAAATLSPADPAYIPGAGAHRLPARSGAALAEESWAIPTPTLPGFISHSPPGPRVNPAAFGGGFLLGPRFAPLMVGPPKPRRPATGRSRCKGRVAAARAFAKRSRGRARVRPAGRAGPRVLWPAIPTTGPAPQQTGRVPGRRPP